MNNLEFLLQQSQEIKNQISALQNNLDATNEQIASLCTSDTEGAKTLRGDTLKATVTHKFTRRLNKSKYREWAQDNSMPEGFDDLIVMEEKLNTKTMKKIENEHPEWLQHLSEFVTLSPAKTSVVVSEIKREGE